MIAQIDAEALLNRWTGHRRVIRAAEMQRATAPRKSTRGPYTASLSGRLIGPLQTPRTVKQLADGLGKNEEAVRYALRGMEAAGLVKRAARLNGRGSPDLWVACEVAP
jgi:predicted ArsR family transcriptional regulator